MKKILLGMATAVLAMGLASCQKEFKPVTPDSVAVITQPGATPEPATAGTRRVTVAATVDGWKAVSEADWITVELTEGMSYTKGLQEVALNYTANTTGAVRKGNVVFSVGGYSETFTLTQSAE